MCAAGGTLGSGIASQWDGEKPSGDSRAVLDAVGVQLRRRPCGPWRWHRVAARRVSRSRCEVPVPRELGFRSPRMWVDITGLPYPRRPRRLPARNTESLLRSACGGATCRNPDQRRRKLRFAGRRRVGARGFEPPTARPPAGCATRLRHAPKDASIPAEPLRPRGRLTGCDRCARPAAPLCAPCRRVRWPYAPAGRIG